MTTFFDLSANLLTGKEQDFSAYKGKVVLVVNVASKCGLVILGFPCNQFGAQEPGDAAEIASFCSLTYPVSFPLFAKVDVNGDDTHPVYQHLKSAAPGLLGTEGVKWNFTKFLVDKKGQVVSRYAPTTTPESLEKDIEELL